jgi:hypothetical protein
MRQKPTGSRVRLRHRNDGLNRNPHGNLNRRRTPIDGQMVPLKSAGTGYQSGEDKARSFPPLTLSEPFPSVASLTDEKEEFTMASFLTYVVVKGDQKEAETKVGKLMGPYDKALQVAEYEGQCLCLHAQVEAKAHETAGARVQEAAPPRGNAFERVTETALALQKAQRAAIQELLDNATPDPNCKECGGSGTIKTTANPNGKWTRWEIGGTFSSNTLAEYLTDVPEDFNIVPVKLVNLAEAPMPVVIISPDGKWHTAGDPDWFGTTRIDDPDWDNTARKILEQHSDAILVVVECQT